MKKILFNSLLAAIIMVIGCQKEDLPDPVHGTPVFSAKLEFGNGVTKSWEAGVDSFYMFTSHEKDQNDVLSFIGKMERENCGSDCRETLTIIIRDISNPSGIPINLDPFSLDSYPYYNNSLEDTILVFDTAFIYEVNLSIDSSVVPLNSDTFYEWVESGNSFDTFPSTAINFGQVTSNDVTLRVTDLSSGDSCVSWQTQFIQISPADRCAVRIEPKYNNDFVLESLEAIPSTLSVTYTLDWSTGSSENFLDGQFEPLIPYSVTLTDGQGCQSVAGFVWSGLTTPTANPGCSAHFDYEVSQVAGPIDTIEIPIPVDSFQFSAVTIIYVDEAGTEYRSDRQKQDQGANFSILNFEDYDENENGQPTKKLDLQFDCNLWDENMNRLTITEGQAIWGVALPK